MTIEQFYEHVQEHGFNGIAPGPGDTMGDRWSRTVSDLIIRAVKTTGVPEARSYVVSHIAQWVYCELAGMRHRVIASPPALRACGHSVTPEDQELAVAVLLATEEI